VLVQGQIAVWQTSLAGDRFAQQANVSWGGDFPSSQAVTIARNTSFQTVMGFGGAFTESASYNFAQLSDSARAALLAAYWGPGSNGYTVGRVPMNSADFSLSSYNQDNVTNDYSLSDFDDKVTRDHQYMIPFIQAAIGANGGAAPGIRLFLSPWSPPPWMKTNHAMIGSESTSNAGSVAPSQPPPSPQASTRV